MKQIKIFFNKQATGRKVSVLFVVTNFIYLLMLFVTIPAVMNFSEGMTLLDMRPTGYSMDEVVSLLDILGAKGRDLYLYRQLPVDMIYPGLFGLTYGLLLAYFLKKLGMFYGAYFYLCLLPLLAGVADYLENVGIMVLLKSFPEGSETLVWITNVFSLLKSTTTTVVFLVFIVLLIILSFRKFKINV